MLQRGFSLMECMVVLVLSACVFTLTWPSFSYFFYRDTEQLAGQQLLSAIRFARHQAIMRNAIITLRKRGSWEKGYEISSEEGILSVFRNPFSQGVLFWRAFPKHQEDLVFLPEGVSKTENGTFWYCDAKMHRTLWAIAVIQTGRARFIVPDSSGHIWDEQGEPLPC
jgi:prepilin-type N-terminal cleavage/methylation domain-containing protein